MTKKAFRGLFLCAVVGALLFRFVRLDVRPMHHDEANQAVKFGALLEKGEYTYDKTDHHGPTLYYAALVAAYARGQATLAELDETTLRLVPVAAQRIAFAIGHAPVANRLTTLDTAVSSSASVAARI